jgi:uroporphyrinogen decarboxylase
LDVILCEPTDKVAKIQDGLFRDEWGVVYQFAEGSSEAYVVGHPLKNHEDIEKCVLPDPLIPDRFVAIGQVIKGYGERFAILAGVESVFEKAYNMRGLYDLLLDFYRNPNAVRKLFEKIARYRIEQAKVIADMGIDIFYTGSDYGTQTGLMVDPELWRNLVKPYEKRIIDIPRSKGIPVFVHSCGNIGAILEDLVEIGVDIINPVQPRALDPAYVKEQFGDRLCLFGTLDVQDTLPFGTPQDVADEVKQRILNLAYGGGLILAPAHTVLPQVPLDNFIAFIDAAMKYGKYPIM